MEKPRNRCFIRASGKPRDPVDIVLTIFRVAAFVVSVCLIVVGSTFLQMLPGDGVSSEASIVTIVLGSLSLAFVSLEILCCSRGTTDLVNRPLIIGETLAQGLLVALSAVFAMVWGFYFVLFGDPLIFFVIIVLNATISGVIFGLDIYVLCRSGEPRLKAATTGWT